MDSKKAFYQKLIGVQSELNAPKNQRNNFGNYNYRSCEDILEGVKPLLSVNGLFMSIADSIELIGDRFYVKATVTVTDGEFSEVVTALAREAKDKKGMDDAQITGSASSYARKYALNAMWAIDDSKDADTDAYQNQQSKPKPQPQQRRPQQQARPSQGNVTQPVQHKPYYDNPPQAQAKPKQTVDINQVYHEATEAIRLCQSGHQLKDVYTRYYSTLKPHPTYLEPIDRLKDEMKARFGYQGQRR